MYFFFFLAAPCGMQDLGSLTRDWACTLAVEAWRKWKPGKGKFNCFNLNAMNSAWVLLPGNNAWVIGLGKQADSKGHGRGKGLFSPLAVPICPHIGCLSFSGHSPWFLPPHLVPRRQKPLLFPGSVRWQVTGIQKKGQDCSLESREGSCRDRHSLAPECARCAF